MCCEGLAARTALTESTVCLFQEKFKVDPDRTLMVGDNMSTDILFGKRNGLKTLLVLSGVATESALNEVKQKASGDPVANERLPHFYMSSLNDWAPYCSNS